MTVPPQKPLLDVALYPSNICMTDANNNSTNSTFQTSNNQVNRLICFISNNYLDILFGILIALVIA